MSDKVEKRCRGANMTATERSTLIDLCSKYSDVVDCKKTDCVATRSKEVAWMSLTDEFNAVCQTRREWRQLKHVRIM